jgi:hypothetical protein
MYLSKESLMVIDLKHLKKGIKKYERVVYTALTLFFFMANYHICWYFYPLDTEEHISNWWVMKVDIYVLIIALCYLSLTTKKSNYKRILFAENFIISFGVGLAFSNVIDRVFLDNRLFNWTAYYPLILIAIVSYYNVKRLTKHAEKHAKDLTYDTRRKKD